MIVHAPSQEPSVGFCATTNFGEGHICAAHERQGSWKGLDIDECVVRCGKCPRCHFISWAAGMPQAGDEDCSWYAECPQLHSDDGRQIYYGAAHFTFRIRNDAGEALAWRARLARARRALVRFQRVLSELGPIPRVLHVTFTSPLNINASTNPLIVSGLQAFAALNPTWRIMVSSDEEVERYLRKYLPASEHVLLDGLHIVEKTDIWRLLKLYREGGLYMDIDRPVTIDVASVLSSNMTRLLLPTVHWGFFAHGQPFDFAQDLMCTAPGNPLFATALRHVLSQRHSCRARCGHCPRGAAHAELCSTLDFGPGAFFRAVTAHLWGAALVGSTVNTSLLTGLDPFPIERLRPIRLVVRSLESHQTLSPTLSPSTRMMEHRAG